MTNKPPRPITAEDLERLAEPLKSSLWPLKYTSPTGRLPRPWPEIWRDRPDAKSGPQPAFLGADFGEIEARTMAAIYSSQRPAQWVHVEYHGGVPRMYRSAWDDANPNPYYAFTFPHIRLMVLADNAITDSFVPYAAHCFNQAVRGGIVFG